MKKKLVRRALGFLFLLFMLANIVAFLHAYKFTHFSTSNIERTSNDLSAIEKFRVAFTGVNNPRPANKKRPGQPYETIIINSNKKLECWLVKTDSAKGTVILFHGYGAEKSSMLDKAELFLQAGYNTMLVDFMGSGGSEGNTTTIGFKEAIEVRDCFLYLKKKGLRNISLFGTSMGAVAIMKAVHDYALEPKSVIIECPFSTMYQTVKKRFQMQGVPPFPMASLLVFWGGVQNNFWAFCHNPVDYAKSIRCPVLLLYGEKDKKVSRNEISSIFKNLKGSKVIVTFPLAGHENYLLHYKEKWSNDVMKFLHSVDQKKLAPAQ